MFGCMVQVQSGLLGCWSCDGNLRHRKSDCHKYYQWKLKVINCSRTAIAQSPKELIMLCAGGFPGSMNTSTKSKLLFFTHSPMQLAAYEAGALSDEHQPMFFPSDHPNFLIDRWFSTWLGIMQVSWSESKVRIAIGFSLGMHRNPFFVTSFYEIS